MVFSNMNNDEVDNTMSIKKIFNCIAIWVFIFCYLLRKCNSVYIDEAHQKIKWIILHLNRELLMEATRNVERIQHLRKNYHRSRSAPVGNKVYHIKSKFARMIRIFLLSNDNLLTYDHNQHIKHMEECHRLSMEIYSIVELVEYWDSFWSKEHREFPAHGPSGGPDDGPGVGPGYNPGHGPGFGPGFGPGHGPGHGPGFKSGPGHGPGFKSGYGAEPTSALPPRRSETIYPLNEDGGGFDSDVN